MVRLGKEMWCNNFEKQNSCDGKEQKKEYYESKITFSFKTLILHVSKIVKSDY
jgi:hypothetical protein